MNHWLVCLPREDMEHCIKIGIFGLPRKLVIEKVRAGDKVVCYVTKERKIIAHGDVTEDYYVDDAAVFLAKGFFPDRFGFSARKLRSEIDFTTLINKLEFIGNKQYWSVYLRNGIAAIPKSDWVLIDKVISADLHHGP